MRNVVICPITLESVKDPVTTPAGHIYEREAILRHIAHSGTDPMTREKLEVKDLRSLRLNFSTEDGASTSQAAVNTSSAQPASTASFAPSPMDHPIFKMAFTYANAKPEEKKLLTGQIIQSKTSLGDIFFTLKNTTQQNLMEYILKIDETLAFDLAKLMIGELNKVQAHDLAAIVHAAIRNPEYFEIGAKYLAQLLDNSSNVPLFIELIQQGGGLNLAPYLAKENVRLLFTEYDGKNAFEAIAIAGKFDVLHDLLNTVSSYMEKLKKENVEQQVRDMKNLYDYGDSMYEERFTPESVSVSKTIFEKAFGESTLSLGRRQYQYQYRERITESIRYICAVVEKQETVKKSLAVIYNLLSYDATGMQISTMIRKIMPNIDSVAHQLQVKTAQRQTAFLQTQHNARMNVDSDEAGARNDVIAEADAARKALVDANPKLVQHVYRKHGGSVLAATGIFGLRGNGAGVADALKKHAEKDDKGASAKTLATFGL